MFRHYISRQFIIFVGVGVTAALSNWVARYLLNEYFSYTLAVFIAYMVGLTSAFFLNRYLVFPGSGRPLTAQAREFLLVNLTFLPVVWGTAVSLRLVFIHFNQTSVADGLAHAISLAVPSLATFLIYKFHTFSDKEESRGQE